MVKVTSSSPEYKALINDVCQFPLCKYSCNGWFQAIVMQHRSGKRCTQLAQWVYVSLFQHISIPLEVTLWESVQYSTLTTSIFVCIKNILFIYSWKTQRERPRHRQREKQAPCREPDVGLNPGSPGSAPGLKAALNRWATQVPLAGRILRWAQDLHTLVKSLSFEYE